MMDATHALSISRQAQLVGISRGSVYYMPKTVGVADLVLMRRLDALHLEHPFMGARMLRDQLNREGFTVGRKHVSTLMARMGMEALYRKPGTSRSTPAMICIPTCYGASSSIGPTRCGRSTRRIFPWPRGLST